MIRQSSPDTGITDFWYDANGAVIKQIDARAIETDFTNDNLGRVLTKTFPASSGENVTYTYDSTASGNKGIGHLTAITDQSGSKAFVVNSLGNISSQTDIIGANSYTTAYTYDAAGNPLTVAYPSGRIVTYSRDSSGRITSITTKQSSIASAVNVATGVGYLPFGPLSGFTFGNSVVLTRSYDQDYRLTGIVASVGATVVQDITNGFDLASNITSITDNHNSSRSQALTYDNLNRVASASGAYGGQSYTYDGVGNRLTKVIGATTDTFAYSSTANRVSTVTTGSNVRSFSYAASGQVTGDTRTSTAAYSFTINNNGRNASASLNGSTSGTYLYNGLEQRAQKTAGGATTQSTYDLAGRLIAEANASGVVQREYIWLNDLPVAIVDASSGTPVIYFIHTDQLGTPQKISDSSGALVWDGVFDPFGVGASVIAANWGSSNWGAFTWGTGGAFLNPLRFPGQYADAETGLNQNWHREYDPTIGRYIQSDPLGVMMDANTYNYASQNPISYTDPRGEFIPLAVALVITGGVVNGLADAASAGPCKNPLAAFAKGFVAGSLGTAAGIAATLTGSGAPMAGAVAGFTSAAVDQALNDEFDPAQLGINTITGAIGGKVASKLLPTKGRLPNLLANRNLRKYGPNSLRMIGQEGSSDAAGAAAGAMTAGGNDKCKCQQ